MPTLPETLVIVLILLLVFTAGRLGAMGDALARWIHGDADGEGKDAAPPTTDEDGPPEA